MFDKRPLHAPELIHSLCANCDMTRGATVAGRAQQQRHQLLLRVVAAVGYMTCFITYEAVVAVARVARVAAAVALFCVMTCN